MSKADRLKKAEMMLQQKRAKSHPVKNYVCCSIEDLQDAKLHQAELKAKGLPFGRIVIIGIADMSRTGNGQARLMTRSELNTMNRNVLEKMDRLRA